MIARVAGGVGLLLGREPRELGVDICWEGRGIVFLGN